MRNFISSLLSIKYGVVLYFIPNILIILIKTPQHGCYGEVGLNQAIYSK